MVATIEELTNQQEAVGKEICTLARNYGKDGPGRKTLDYLNARWTRLNELWEVFDNVDSEIRDNYPQVTEHEYFTKGFYDGVKKIHDQMKDDIIKRFAVAEEEKSDGAIEETAAVHPQPEQLKEALLGPAAVKPPAGHSEGVTAAISKFNIPPGLTIKPTLIDDTSVKVNRMTTDSKFRLLCKIFQGGLNKCPLKLRETLPQEFNQKTKTLMTNWDEITTTYRRLGGDAAVEDIQLYFELQDELDLRITWLPTNTLPAETVQMNQGRATTIKLPKIEIPKFDGSYLNWPQFFDLYKQMVHNQPIAPAQKLYFLKTNLTGDAQNLIQHFHATDDNYELAWNTLVDRFNNKRLLLSAQLSRLFQSNTIVDTVRSLKRLHDTTKEVIQAINNLGYDTSGWDPLVVHLLLEKMDKDTRMLFEESLQAPRITPTLTQLLEFVECRFQALETVKSDERKKAVTTASENREVSNCPYCKTNNHKIFNCKKFINLSVEDRNQQVRKLQLCTNCLQGHRFPSCQQQRRCKVCNGKHNTLLHYPNKKDVNVKNPASDNTECKESPTPPIKDDLEESSCLNTSPTQKPARDPPVKTWCCEICGKFFSTKQKLTYHNLVHTKEKNYACSLCPKHHSTIFRHRDHMKTHANIRNYECEYCKERFFSKSILVCHRRRHTGERPYKCDICGKAFTQASIMKTHAALHTGKTVACDLCPKKFTRPSHLILHQRSHTGERPYMCTMCPNRYSQKSHLDRHLDTHMGVKHTCEVCGKSYTKKSSLNKHKFVHDTNKSFKCDECQLEFATKDRYNRHMKNTHKNSKKEEIPPKDFDIKDKIL